MTTHRTIQLCLVAAFLMVMIMVWLTQSSRSESRGALASPGQIQSTREEHVGEAGTSVRMSSGDVMLFLGRNAIGLGGFGPLDFRKALTNRAHLETQARLLAGQKLYTLKTANASLGQLMVALSYYANKEVLVIEESQEAWTGKFGPFDSTAYLTRFGAASAMEERLNKAGWHVLRLTDGKLMFVTDADRKRLVDGRPLVEMPSPPPTRTTPSPEGGPSDAVPGHSYE